ncbi:MAG TPA: autotransporter outer membrane beta-barrel domain-containing protein [Myxococcales bacterium]|nr:autotransporter outer membrane beta-barrel domain-containing protein [Myxococcales bacterium]
MRTGRAFVALLALAAGPAGAQTMLDQEQRLIDIHALLLDLPPVDAPGAYDPGQFSLALEIIGVPPIDGTTGNKHQFTASDRSIAFPRPRVALGLPAPEGFRAFVGLSYVPPIQAWNVKLNYIAGEAGIAWAPGPARVGFRAHLLYGESESPVTDPVINDTLRITEFGAELSGGYDFAFGRLTVTPYGGAGVSHSSGNFRVTSDAVTLVSDNTAAALHAGVRLLFGKRWEGAAEVDYYPGFLIHPNFRLAWLFDLF